MKRGSAYRGIALISLAVVIIVLMMLSGIITYISYDIISESQKTAFLHDVEIINDAVEEYYAVNGSLPILKSGVNITANEYKQEINRIYGLDVMKSLENQMSLAGDSDSNFYEVDIKKLNVKASKFGLKKDANDIFLVSTNDNIYYYSGYKISADMYFSTDIITENKY